MNRVYRIETMKVESRIIRLLSGRLIIPVCLLLLFFNASGQTGLGMGGGDHVTDSFNISYSIGQLFYESMTDDAYYVSQGLQHPLVYLYTGSILDEISNQELLVYPNPVAEKLSLIIISDDYQDISVKLYNMQGMLLLLENSSGAAPEILMGQFDPGVYLLKVYRGKTELKTFKVLKQ